ncbi:MAG TPA: type II toxin-antitoxin system RelE/ParE family toxin [Candidatus Methylomirabilis sp.]|nr:type II toxin-antitoxin system RelE/ParE family toxin [Candidatus Methylomirabilis sp.]
MVRFYQAEDGKTPVKDFLDSLPGKIAQKVLWVLMVAEELDILPTTYFKKLVGSDDIWECRVQFGSNDYRILCFHEGGSVLVLTHGFMKKTQKTPAKEIERAETYKRDYLRRHKRHE